jgi:hypothetical protein
MKLFVNVKGQYRSQDLYCSRYLVNPVYLIHVGTTYASWNQVLAYINTSWFEMTHNNHVTTDHQTDILGETGTQINQSRPGARKSGQHKHLRSVVKKEETDENS